MTIEPNRRELLIGMGAASLAVMGPPANAQQRRPIRLMVVRRSVTVPLNSCAVPCIRGRIYDVSGLGERALDTTILPLLAARQPICDTIERPWRNNRPNVSSIPAGRYGANVRTDATKSWMTNINRIWRLELSGVPHRSNIQFHYGEDEAWSEGCFILGTLLSSTGTSMAAYCQLTNGEQAVAALRAAVSAPGANLNDIAIGICDDNGLFGDFRPGTSC